MRYVIKKKTRTDQTKEKSIVTEKKTFFFETGSDPNVDIFFKFSILFMGKKIKRFAKKGEINLIFIDC